jgi:CDP-diacylglycerol--glycerol-3-phosphate 3-phosphatidyltransferase
MMLDNQQTRAIANRGFVPIAKFLLKIGLSANSVTLITGLSLVLIIICTIPFSRFGWALLFSLPLVFGDALDGTMARLTQSTSKFGGFLDSVVDRFTDATIVGAYIAWAIYAGQDSTALLAMGVLATGFLIPYIRAKAESVGIDCKVGLMERTERLLVLGIITLLAAFDVVDAIWYGMALLLVLNTLTVLQRLVHVYRRDAV